MIAGGGNLASTWPLHVYERAALAGIAARLGRPLVVSGQTLGPTLLGRDRELVGELLRSARLVGVRESSSHALAAELGVAARVGVDDASFLGMTDTGCRAGTERCARQPVALARRRTPSARPSTAIAALVDAAADDGRRTGAVPRPLRPARTAPSRAATPCCTRRSGPDADPVDRRSDRAVRGKPHPSPGPPRC